MPDSDVIESPARAMPFNSQLYEGYVFHKRFRPARHALRYSVFAILFDLDELSTLDKKLRLFSYNRWNVFSLFDRDFGKSAGLTGESLIRAELADIGLDSQSLSIRLLCYPRIFGYAFNPLCTYYCCSFTLLHLTLLLANFCHITPVARKCMCRHLHP